MFDGSEMLETLKPELPAKNVGTNGVAEMTDRVPMRT